MLVIGLIWFVSQLLRRWVEPVPLTAGIWLGDLWLLPLAFLLAGFPLARLHGPLDRVLIGALAIVMIPLEFAVADVPELRVLRRPGVPRNVLMVADEPAIAERGRHRPARDPDRRAGHAGDRARPPLAATPAHRCGACSRPCSPVPPAWRC